MTPTKRVDRYGKTYYSFIYQDENTRKRVRLKKSEHPLFDNYEDALSWAKSQEAYKVSRKAYIERKLAWKTAYYQFDDLLKKYENWQKERAPNSFKNNVYCLEQFVFQFFLNEKHASNVNDWHLQFREFRDWLNHDIAKTRAGKPLAASTINNIIRSLNTFLTFLNEYNLIDMDSAKKCTALPDHMLNRRGFEDVIDFDELNMICQNLKRTDEAASDFLYVLWHTGMRFSELFGLPITALFKGTVPHQAMDEELTKCGISYIGYIYLNSQPFHDDHQREEDKSLKRKPLKSHKEISPKHSRVIPIRSKEVWNILARRYKQGLEDYVKRIYTASKEDYVLFEDLEWNKAVNSLRKAYLDLGLEPKQYHCCRHSFATFLVGETRSFFLVRAITGHKKDKSFERYLHVYEELSIKAQQNDQVIEEIV